MKIRALIGAIALSVVASSAVAGSDVTCKLSDKNCYNSAKQFAPGQRAKAGKHPASYYAPGQMAKKGKHPAQYYAPGQVKKRVTAKRH